MFKPLIPIIRDALSHTFNEISHIATVHAKYGRNHLATELTDTGIVESKNHNTLQQISEVPIHVSIGTHKAVLNTAETNHNYCFFTLSYISAVYIFFQAPPPKFC